MIKRCVKCFRARPKLAEHKMGIDYYGPFYIKEKKYRNHKRIKTYVAVFICMSSKAIHIEVVSDLTIDTFLGALRRAKNKLYELYALANSDGFKTTVNNYASNNGIEFHFIPPSSSYFGGLWEVGVKSYKHHFTTVAYNHVLTFEEFYTLSLEIELILNSRPLTPIPTDTNDLSALTAGHFLIGDSLIALPEPDYTPLPSNRLSAWQLITKIREDFWKRWSTEYLNEVNVRRKWNCKTKNPEEGTIVIIKDDNTPTMQRPLARITQLHKGKDGIVRAVTLKTANGVVKRTVKKIAILPIASD
ncbi:uncharacterized protein LOC131663021 [Phymastichus coffea]|uniref:uncharacterized protein LOC131663021 n=1 Tax=Phymastichus coffea TaxID=108790 RepID=UPI00273BE0A8|nr:uncharacterized protein LOC131663021 [Phymastichus coffea]